MTATSLSRTLSRTLPRTLSRTLLIAALCLAGLVVTAFRAGAADTATMEQVRQRLEAARPGLVLDIQPSPQIKGFYSVTLAGGTKAHVTADGRFLLPADVWEVRDEGLVNLTEAARETDRARMLAAVDTEEMTVFSPSGAVRAHVNVFTDVDCGYCRKFHQEVPALNDMGIEVRYLAYPRAGLQSAAYNKLVSAWCSSDPKSALTRLKAGQSIPPRTCENPVSRHYSLGQRAGISGTPAIITTDGRIVGGYLEADRLAAALELN